MNSFREKAWPVLALTAAVLSAAAPARAQPAPSADTVRGKATEVFNRPEFRPSEPKVGNWLLRQLGAFFHWLGTLYDDAPALFWLILIGCLIALVALVVLMIFQIRTAFSVGWRDRSAAGDRTAQRIRVSAEYREKSDRCAAAGDYTEAVRFLFLSLVYRLDERGRVSFHKDYTNREYLDLVGDRLHVRDALRLLVDVLDDHWYGERPSVRAQYDACRDVYDRLVTA